MNGSSVSDSTPGAPQINDRRDATDVASNGDAGMQSPASTLADTLSLLSLSTPAAAEFKASRLGQDAQQRDREEPRQSADSQSKDEDECALGDKHDGAKQAASRPERPQEGDLPVGLIYDAIMEEHRGPPGADLASTAPQPVPAETTHCLPKGTGQVASWRCLYGGKEQRYENRGHSHNAVSKSANECRACGEAAEDCCACGAPDRDRAGRQMLAGARSHGVISSNINPLKRLCQTANSKGHATLPTLESCHVHQCSNSTISH